MPGSHFVVVLLGAEVHHGGAEQAPLDAGLDLQGRVGGDQLLEAGDVAAVVLGAAERWPGTPGGRRRCPPGSFSCPKARGRCSGVRQAFDLVQLGRDPRAPRAWCRMSAHLPSSCSPRAATSTAGTCASHGRAGGCRSRAADGLLGGGAVH